MERLIKQYIKDTEVRKSVVKWPSQVKTIVDGYRVYTTVSHAVQKDAVQNGWSARKNKRGKEWKFTFELIEDGKTRYLLMTDYGTTGLTGRVLKPEEYEKDLPAEEKWGRIEGVSFTQPRTERTLGSRGRGKFIFVGASEEYTILYDTLRDDGVYRFGFRTVEKTESPVAAYEGERGKKKLLKITGGIIKPLSHIGTRIIIVNPIDELVKDIKRGNFLRYIGETWWEIILKYNVYISVIESGKEYRASIPSELDLKEKDSRNFKFWLKKNEKIGTGGKEFKIKKLHIIHKKAGEVPSDIQGIAIQRGGMKICSIEARYLGRELAERIYGYITFGYDTEEELLVDEGPEHYFYDFRKSLPGAIRRYVEEQILAFAKEKLGYGVDERQIRRQQQRNAERRALVAVNKFARAFGIGPGKRKRKGGGGRGPIKKVRIQLPDFALPREDDLRVNYGEKIKEIKFRIINDSNEEIFIRLKAFLRFYDKLIKIYAEEDVRLSANSKGDYYGPFEELFMKEKFPDKGKHTVVSKIVSLRDDDKGTELDYKTRSFYLEEDPPMGGLFERCEAFGFPDEEPIKYWMGYSELGSEKGLLLYYNVSHPSYVPVAENEEDLAEYILRIAGHEMCSYDLLQDRPVFFEAKERNDPQAILIQIRKIIGELLYKFHRGEI